MSLRIIFKLVLLLVLTASFNSAASAVALNSPRTAAVVPSEQAAAASGDLNKDGFPDLIVGGDPPSGGGVGKIYVLLGKGNGNFQPPQVYEVGDNSGVVYPARYVQQIKVADMNNDGSLRCGSIIERTLKTVALLCFSHCLLSCVGTSEECRRVLRPEMVKHELPENISIDELVILEKCGFEYRPNISFYREIVSSREYPLPSLLKELRQSANDYWTAHLVYLIKAAIESERFHSEVMRDREMINNEVDIALNRVQHIKVREDVRNDRDGIVIYFLKKDGAVF